MNSILHKIKLMITPLLLHIQKHLGILAFGVFTLTALFLGFHINQLTQSEPSQIDIQEKLTNVQRPKIDQKTLDKIQQLQDQNVQIQVLFDNARDNPFDE